MTQNNPKPSAAGAPPLRHSISETNLMRQPALRLLACPMATPAAKRRPEIPGGPRSQQANLKANDPEDQSSNSVISATSSGAQSQEATGSAAANSRARDASPAPGEPARVPTTGGPAPSQGQWLVQVASQTQAGVRHQLAQASGQLNQSLRQLYASASSIGGPADAPPSYHNIPGTVPYYHGRTIGPPPSYDDVINPFAPPPTYQSLFGQVREARKTSRSLLDLLRRLLIIVISTLGCTIIIGFMFIIPFTMIILGAIYIDECKVEHIPAFLLVGGLVWATKNMLHIYSQCRKVEQEEQSEALATAAELYLTTETRGASSFDSVSSTSSFGNNELADEVEDDDDPDEDTDGHIGAPPGVDLLQPGQQIERPRRQRRRRPRSSLAAVERDGSTRAAADAGQRHARRLKSSICESLLNCILFGWFIAGCIIVFRTFEPDYENPTSARYCHRTVYTYTFWLIVSGILSVGIFIGCVCCLMVSSAIASRQDDLDLA